MPSQVSRSVNVRRGPTLQDQRWGDHHQEPSCVMDPNNPDQSQRILGEPGHHQSVSREPTNSDGVFLEQDEESVIRDTVIQGDLEEVLESEEFSEASVAFSAAAAARQAMIDRMGLERTRPTVVSSGPRTRSEDSQVTEVDMDDYIDMRFGNLDLE